MSIKITQIENLTIKRYKYFDIDEKTINEKFGSEDNVKKYFNNDSQNDDKANEFFNLLFNSKGKGVKDVVINIEGGNFVLGERTPNDDKLKTMEWSSKFKKYIKSEIS